MVDPAVSHRKANFVQVSSISSWDQEMPQRDSSQQIDIFHTSLFGKKGGCKKLDIKNNGFFLHVLAENSQNRYCSRAESANALLASL